MRIVTDIKDANTLLQLYIGSTFQIVVYSASLRRMAFRLILPNVDEVLYVVGIGCESLKGRFSFSNANLNISIENTNENNEFSTIIEDKLAEFSLITSGGFSLAQGTESEFGESFENFLVDKK